ncbi:MAG: diguanylate cyclase domain-containing protein [Gammaproteobacteria bacterium]
MDKKAIRFVMVMAGFLLCCAGHATAAALEGNPPFSRFVPDLDVYPQNFALAEDSDSIVYVGNSNGVLTFDGTRWKLIALPNRQLVRALAYDGGKRVYVGGYNDFGYIVHDAAGQAVYHDLTPAFKYLLQGRKFADIWDVLVSSQGIFFRAVKYLFLYNPANGQVRMWYYPGRFGALGSYHGDVIMQFRGRGIEAYRNGKWALLPGGEDFKHLIYSFMPLVSGGLLTLAADGRWRVYRDGHSEPFKVPAGLPSSSHFFGECVLKDGTLALTSDDGSLYFLSPQGRLRRVILADAELSGLVLANDGGLLTIGNQALFHVRWPTNWTTLNEGQGLYGSLNRAVQWNGDWFLLSGAGVFRVLQDSSSAAPRFRHLDWTGHEAWDLLPLDKHDALLAESYAVVKIHDGTVRTITHEHLYPRLLVRSRFHPDRIYVGTEQGLATLIRNKTQWHLGLDAEDVGAPRVNSIIEMSPNRIWLGYERGGVHLIELDKDGTHIVSQQRFGADQGLDYGDTVDAVNLARLADGSLIASTAKGVFRWNGKRFEPDDLGGLNRLRHKNEWLNIGVTSAGLWAYSYDHIYHRDLNAMEWRSEPIGQIRRGAIQTLSRGEDDSIVFVSTNAILYYRKIQAQVQRRIPHVLLRSVELTRPDGSHEYLPLNAGEPVQLKQGAFALAFDFSLPDYSGRQAARFQARLQGFESRFSAWASNGSYTYSRLHPAVYQFELRGRDSQGNITAIEPFRFEVLPKWYASGWARALWLGLSVLAALLIVMIFVRFRTRKLAGEKILLEAMVVERTEELKTANSRLETMAHLDGLTGIPNRRRMDDYLAQVWRQCIERGRPLSVLVIDVDNFKDYNDRYGHLEGDVFLKKLTAILSRCLRRTEDLLARYGGEEFLVVLPGAKNSVACELAENMRSKVEAAKLGPTISLGVATAIPTSNLTVATLLKCADTALYRAKADGRNRVMESQEGL